MIFLILARAVERSWRKEKHLNWRAIGGISIVSDATPVTLY
jgi:hypothetical protein